MSLVTRAVRWHACMHYYVCMHALLRVHAVASRHCPGLRAGTLSAAESLSYLSGQANGLVKLVMVLRLVM
jgi:hypothetical protein